MKTIIQISILLLAILVGSLWQIFKPQIHDFFKLPVSLAVTEQAEPLTVSDQVSDQTRPELVAPPTHLPSKTQINKVKASPLPPKIKLAETDPDPVDMPSLAEPPLPTTEEAIKKQQAHIQRIVLKRYPDIPKIPFSEKYPSLDKLPGSTFPKRIQIAQELNFKLTQGEKTVGLSVVKANGFVHPRRIEGANIEVSSLANDQMLETLPLSQTDFAAVIKANYDAGLERAIVRLEKMRAADKAEILKNPTLYQSLIDEGNVWHDPEADQFDYVKLSAKQKLAGSPYKPVAFFSNGDVRVSEEGPYSGVYFVIIVLLEGDDIGFGPYHWHMKCLLRNGQIVGWLGIPGKSAGTGS